MRAPRSAAFAAALTLALALAAPAPALDLIGTWHVLVHYKDSATENPDRERWQDRVWEFSMEGDRLKWVDYPIVVFADDTGRFENLGGNRASRVLHFWEPNEAQLTQIQQGLEINHRGSRTKTLRGVPGGWSSGEARPGYQSARFITFTETWSIEGLPDQPVFSFEDSMGSASTESFEGRTVFTVETVEPGGDVVRGRYDRDGSRVGTFRLTRAGAAEGVKGSGDASKRLREAFASQLGIQVFPDQAPGGGTESDLRAKIAAGQFTDDDRRELRVGFEKILTDQWQAAGNDPLQGRLQIQSLARQMTDLVVDDGKTFEEVTKMLKTGEITP